MFYIKDFFENSNHIKTPKNIKKKINELLPKIYLEIYAKYGIKLRFVANKKEGYYFDKNKFEFIKK